MLASVLCSSSAFLFSRSQEISDLNYFRGCRGGQRIHPHLTARGCGCDGLQFQRGAVLSPVLPPLGQLAATRKPSFEALSLIIF